MNQGKVLVLVTSQYSCERLILVGAKIAEEKKAGFQVLSVQSRLAIAKNTKELEYLCNVAQENHAEMTIFFDDDPAKIISEHIKNIGATYLVAGHPPKNKESKFLKRLMNLTENSVLYIVDDAGKYIAFEKIRA